MRGFDWDDIQVFLAISRADWLTVAAQQMSVDHSTLSRRVAALEKALGVKLFDRSSLGFVLTPESERVLRAMPRAWRVSRCACVTGSTMHRPV